MEYETVLSLYNRLKKLNPETIVNLNPKVTYLNLNFHSSGFTPFVSNPNSKWNLLRFENDWPLNRTLAKVICDILEPLLQEHEKNLITFGKNYEPMSAHKEQYVLEFEHLKMDITQTHINPFQSNADLKTQYKTKMEELGNDMSKFLSWLRKYDLVNNVYILEDEIYFSETELTSKYNYSFGQYIPHLFKQDPVNKYIQICNLSKKHMKEHFSVRSSEETVVLIKRLSIESCFHNY